MATLGIKGAPAAAATPLKANGTSVSASVVMNGTRCPMARQSTPPKLDSPFHMPERLAGSCRRAGLVTAAARDQTSTDETQSSHDGTRPRRMTVALTVTIRSERSYAPQCE